MLPREIVSGGQTGADRAGLDWAIGRGIPHGGWCPEGRLAEDGPIPGRYQLRETPGGEYALRTEWNVRDSDATVIFSLDLALTGGSALTWELAGQNRKLRLHLARANYSDVDEAGGHLREFVDANFVEVLNVAGSRNSTEPGIGEFVRGVLDAAFPAGGRSAAGAICR